MPKARGTRGVWEHAPQKILKSESLKTQFPTLSGRWLCQKVPKIDYLLLNLAEKIVAISYIFKIDNYFHIPFIKCLQNSDTTVVFYEGPKSAQ